VTRLSTPRNSVSWHSRFASLRSRPRISPSFFLRIWIYSHARNDFGTRSASGFKQHISLSQSTNPGPRYIIRSRSIHPRIWAAVLTSSTACVSHPSECRNTWARSNWQEFGYQISPGSSGRSTCGRQLSRMHNGTASPGTSRAGVSRGGWQAFGIRHKFITSPSVRKSQCFGQSA
jgi:hypothetical protein